MKPIVVVGSYNTGMTIRAEKIPRRGETVRGLGYSEGPGGKGSNQAIAAARLGAKVRLVGCVGADRFGNDAFALWESEGISVEFAKRGTKHTGIGFILVEPDGSNAIAVESGANSELTPSDLQARSAAFQGCSTLLTQFEIPSDTAAAAAKIAKGQGARVILNPAPALPASEIDFSCVDIITPNETEFTVLSGTEDIDRGAKTLLAKGPSAVVVTVGAKGARVVTKDDAYSVPSSHVRAVDSTGAGDAFNGALAVALSEGEPLASAVRFANYAGAFTVTRPEVVPALPSRRELDGFLRTDCLQ